MSSELYTYLGCLMQLLWNLQYSMFCIGQALMLRSGYVVAKPLRDRSSSPLVLNIDILTMSINEYVNFFPNI